MIKVKSFTFNAFAENTYVLSDHTKACIIIDPGCYEAHEQQELQAYIAEERLRVEKIVNTHCHIDHVLGNYWCQQAFKSPIYIPEMELPQLKAIPSYASMYGFPQYVEAKPSSFLEEEDTLTFGKSALQVLFVPGHSPGHLAFYSASGGFCIGGDVLFQGSIGRTDLPGGNFKQLIDSIHTKLFALPDDTVVHCGHGPSTTIGEEKESNPFCGL
jgi:glyoxylase-like metal-dependent hydrolase (beta-lactamase superfamily II)